MQCTHRIALIKKAPLIVRRAFQYRTLYCLLIISELICLALLQAGVGTLLYFRKAGCQGVIGPYPSTFLNK